VADKIIELAEAASVTLICCCERALSDLGEQLISGGRLADPRATQP
jgi:hypothetical protein